eukprot:1985380-Ditylum_brightwellii.AAC.1
MIECTLNLLCLMLKTNLRGQFVPTKAWLVTSRDAYRNLSPLHNAYIKEITVITMEGVYPTVADKYISVVSKTMSIKDYLLQKTDLIKSVEQTNNSKEKGKWLFIIKKPNAATVSNFLDNELQNLYKSIVPNNQKIDMVPIPCCAKLKAAQTVGSYAGILMGLSNPQDDSTGSNTNTIRPRKRAVVAVETSVEDNPMEVTPTNITPGKNSPIETDNAVTMETLEQKLSNF